MNLVRAPVWTDIPHGQEPEPQDPLSSSRGVAYSTIIREPGCGNLLYRAWRVSVSGDTPRISPLWDERCSGPGRIKALPWGTALVSPMLPRFVCVCPTRGVAVTLIRRSVLAEDFGVASLALGKVNPWDG